MGWMYGKPAALVPAEETLSGGSAPVNPQPAKHAVLGTPITGPWEDNHAVLYLALGCFWGAEKLYWETPGVVATAVGYAGGNTPNPTYQEVCTGRTNHTEVVQVVFDPARVSAETLLIAFFEAHDPTQGFRQGNDVGTQYRSAIYTTTKEHAALAARLAASYQGALSKAGYGAITTEIGPLADTPAGQFYLAEEEHQQYLHKNPHGYCPHHSTGVACTLGAP